MPLIYAFYLFFIYFSSAFAQDTIRSFSLADAKAEALKYNFKVKQSNLDLKSAQKQINTSITQGLFTVDGNVQYVRNLNLPVNYANFGGVEQEIKLGTNNNLNAAITANLLLFDGTYIVGVQAAKAYQAFVDLQKKATDHDVIDAVTQAYYAVLAAKKNLEYLRESEKNTNKVVSDMTEMYNVGYIEETDLDQVKVNQVKVQNNIYTLEQQQKISEKMFKYQIGVSLDEPVVLTDSLEQFMVIDPTYTQKLRSPYEPKWDINYRLAKENASLLYKQTLITYFKMLPSLLAFGSWSYQSYTDQFDFSKGSSYPSSIGFTIKVPMFSSFARIYAGQKDKVNWEKAKVTLASTEQDVALQMESLLAEYYANFASFEASKKNMDLYYKIYRNAEIKFANSKMSSYDFAQMQIQFIQAQTDYVAAMVSLLNTQSKIQKVFNNQQ
jgi:outer membrane protein TolC